MKKLLAIAVAAAITVPMVAMADTTVYGKAHMSIAKTSDISGLSINSHSSRIGLKGSNALDNGLTATHQFEIGYNFIDQVGATSIDPITGLLVTNPHGDDNKARGFSARNSWVGLKGGFGEFRIGRQTTPYSIVDDASDFLIRNGQDLHTFTRTANALAYINKFGSVGFALAYVAQGEAEGGAGSDNTSNILVNYSAGPLYAGVAYQKSTDVKAGTKLALAYKGANYGIGYAFEKHPGSGVKSSTLAGKYSFGKAHLAAQFGKNSSGSKTKQKNVELGYSLGKGTTTYYEWEDYDGVKSNRVGLTHKF